MTRGRPPKVTDTRLLAEILLQPDQAVYSGQISKHVDIGQEAVRKRLTALESEGYVEIEELESHNIYRLSEAGYERVAQEIRSALS